MREFVKKALDEEKPLISEEKIKEIINKTIKACDEKLEALKKKKKITPAQLKRREQEAKAEAINIINKSDAYVLIAIKKRPDKKSTQVVSMLRHSDVGLIIHCMTNWVKGMMFKTMLGGE